MQTDKKTQNDLKGGTNLAAHSQGKNKDKIIWYNPSHGFFGDLIESGVDVIGNDYGVQTGISKQAQKFQESHKDLNIYMHSQGNAITVQGAKSSKENGHTYFSYGSPISNDKMKDIFNIDNPKKNEGDYVANPLNIFNLDTWNKPGHATENYGAVKLLRYKEPSNEK